MVSSTPGVRSISWIRPHRWINWEISPQFHAQQANIGEKPCGNSAAKHTRKTRARDGTGGLDAVTHREETKKSRHREETKEMWMTYGGGPCATARILGAGEEQYGVVAGWWRPSVRWPMAVMAAAAGRH